MTQRPLCFVLMPFGTKSVGGSTVDFDAVYTSVVAPAIDQAELQPLRADEEMAGGIIHKPMFERLVLCEYAVADLTTANANVFYELGVRHATRSRSTLLLFAEGRGQLPFDVAPLRALPYRLGADGKPDTPEEAVQAITERLLAAKAPDVDSPLYQLLEDYPDIDHEKTDVFRDRVEIGETFKRELEAKRRAGVAAIKAAKEAKDDVDAARRAAAADVRTVEDGMGDLEAVEAAAVIDLLLSYRAVEAWADMVRLIERLPLPLRNTVMVQEQLGLALNRDKRSEEAEHVLQDLLEKRGDSSETLGILGRVYKDRWDETRKDGKQMLARGLLEKAIETYLKGFEADWRDAYPGVNAVTLMEMAEPPDQRQQHLIPIVTYAVERRIARGKPDYWDHATLLELAVLGNDQAAAATALSTALASNAEGWQMETTANNLRLIQQIRQRRNESQPWLAELIDALAANGTGATN